MSISLRAFLLVSNSVLMKYRKHQEYQNHNQISVQQSNFSEKNMAWDRRLKSFPYH